MFDLLEQVMTSAGGSSFPDLARGLGIPKSSLHALLAVMAQRQYLEIDPGSRKIRLGLRALELGQAYLSAQDLIETARRLMQALVAEVNETAQLAQLSGQENVYLARVDSSHPLRLQSQPGIRLPAHATGVGKAILAERSGAEIEALYPATDLPRFGPKTLGTRSELLAELRESHRRGFAIDNEEYTPGIFCLAVPVHEPGRPVTVALSVSVPVSRASGAALARILPRLAGCSAELSRRLGGGAADPRLARLAAPEVAQGEIAAMINSGRYDLPFG